MADSDLYPMSPSLRRAFHEVVEQHIYGWHGEPPEPMVSLDLKPYSISTICDFVNNPNFVPETMPDVLVHLINKEVDLSYPALTNFTYHGGAAYVAQIIRERQERFKARQAT